MHHPPPIPAIVADTTRSRVIESSYCPDTGEYAEVESAVIAWELSPTTDPHPITMLGPLEGLAWGILEPNGTGHVIGETVCPDRVALVGELRRRARELAGEGQS